MDLRVKQGVIKLQFTKKMLLYPNHKILIQIIIEWHHISAGLTGQILSNLTHQTSYISCVWFQDIINFLFKYNIHDTIYQFLTIKVQRMNDRCIMFELIQLQLTTEKLRQLNVCRLYLHISLLNDVITPNGKIIMIQFLRGMQPNYQRSIFYWPNQDIPSKSAYIRWFKRTKQTFKMGNNGELPVSKQLREQLIPIKERQIIHRLYYSEVNKEIYEIKNGFITRYFVHEGKYQKYSPNFDSKEKCNFLPEDTIPIAKRERTTFKIDNRFSYQDKIIDNPTFR